MPAIPEKRKKAIIKAILESLENGTTIAAACKAAEIAPWTFLRWRKADEALAAECESRLEAQIACVEDALYKNCLGGVSVSQFFFLCNRAPDRWQHVNRVINEHSGEIGVTLKGLMEQFLGGDGRKPSEETAQHDSADGPSL